jgi:hypothetical protein
MEAVPGYAITFQVSFRDASGSPVAVPDAIIVAFKYSNVGVRDDLIPTSAMSPSDPAEVGRYTYTWTVPITLTQGDIVYIEMTGTPPGEYPVKFSETVDIVPAAETLMSPGLKAQFVKSV